MDTRDARTWAMWTCLAAGHLSLIAIHLFGDVAIAVAYSLLAIGLGLEFWIWFQNTRNRGNK
jgi:hypothetical protein